MSVALYPKDESFSETGAPMWQPASLTFRENKSQESQNGDNDVRSNDDDRGFPYNRPPFKDAKDLHELFLRRYKRISGDKNGPADSPSARFKSSFAKEVVHNVRKNKLYRNKPIAEAPGRLSHPGADTTKNFPQNGLSCRSQSIDNVSSSRRSVQVQAELCGSTESLAWMSASTFKTILDRQEEAETNGGYYNNNVISSSSSCQSLYSIGEEQNISIEKLLDLMKKVGRYWDSLSNDEWIEVYRILRDRNQITKQGEFTETDLYFAHRDVYRRRKTGGKTTVQVEDKLEESQDRIHELEMEKDELQRICLTIRKQYDAREKEIEHLRYQLKAVESSRKTYEFATNRLLHFLEQASIVLQSTSPGYRRLVERTRAEVSALTQRADARGISIKSEDELSSSSGRKMKRSYSTNSRLPSLDEETPVFAETSDQPPLPPRRPLSKLVDYENLKTPSSLLLSVSVGDLSDTKNYSYHEEFFSSPLKDRRSHSVAEINNNKNNSMDNRSKISSKKTKKQFSRSLLLVKGVETEKPAINAKTYKIMRSVKLLLAREKTTSSINPSRPSTPSRKLVKSSKIKKSSIARATNG